MPRSTLTSLLLRFATAVSVRPSPDRSAATTACGLEPTGWSTFAAKVPLPWLISGGCEPPRRRARGERERTRERAVALVEEHGDVGAGVVRHGEIGVAVVVEIRRGDRDGLGA